MRITRFETHLCSYTFPEAQSWWGGQWDRDLKGVRYNAVILRVHTDEGLTGLGEASPWGDCPAMAAALHRLEARFRGRDPFDVEKLTARGPDLQTNNVLGAIDCALWDIIGKATDTPVFRLLAADGDVQPTGLRTYASGGVGYHWLHEPDQIFEEIARLRAEGFTAFKMRIGSAWGLAGMTVERFAAHLARVRQALGDEIDLMLDANNRFRTVEEALAVARVLDELGARWFEDPLSIQGADDPAHYNRLRAGVQRVAISGGEGWNTLSEHQPFLRARAYDLVHIDASWLGLTHAYRLARLYHALGLPCIPHSWTNAIAQAINAHLVAAIPNRVMLETQHIDNPMLTELVDAPIPVDRGQIDVPERPGLGIALNEEALARYPFTENGIFVPWP